MNKILITGSKGQLGSEIEELHKMYPYSFIFTDKDELDITKKEEIKSLCEKENITHIINCAAYTAVDNAENDKELANLINHNAVENLAQISKEKNISLVHISTDYVFDGKNNLPYKEDNKTNPQGVYGKTKLDGEKKLLKINPKNSIIIRTSWVYSFYGNNFVKTMLKLGKTKEKINVVYDQIGTPTYAKDLAKCILDIISKINNENVEIYHYSNEGVLSWYDFAKEVMSMAKLDCIVGTIETKDYPTLASRPNFSLLNKTKIKDKFDIEVPYWKDGLYDCLKRLGEIK